jgi:hypothetical protein
VRWTGQQEPGGVHPVVQAAKGFFMRGSLRYHRRWAPSVFQGLGVAEPLNRRDVHDAIVDLRFAAAGSDGCRGWQDHRAPPVQPLQEPPASSSLPSEPSYDQLIE